ncbi:transcription termination factor MTERF8, chloroplastic [Senna tora]|uniref:Transcription termination factor MTERF8, chloroplastic n=1 Tax=Senna tora TaxID=362788 RepID=A0A834WSP8_9FABA|nr:transcription termination factor MTERF8, chloroplastic [Senna tora]
MLCSAPPAKSGSNWLDRLRSIKGIPTADDLDLDSFLSTHHHSSDPPTRLCNRTRLPDLSPPESPDPIPLTSLIADLFSITQSSKLSRKKCPRKQTNPKSFLPSSSSSSSSLSGSSRIIHCAPKDDIDNTVPCTNSSSVNNKRVLEMGVKVENNTASWDEDVEEVEESGGNELKGFSKSEVTVIDTSCSDWKVEKFVFRKKSVWKVREKKGKSKLLGKKKRKGSFGFDNNKELKLLQSHQFGSSLVETDMQELITRSTQGLNTEQKMKDVNEDTPEDVPKPPPKKRQHSRSQALFKYVSSPHWIHQVLTISFLLCFFYESMAFHTYPLTLSASLHSVSAFYPQPFFSDAKVTQPSRSGTFKLLSSKECFRHTTHAFFQCRCSNSLSNPVAETGMLFSFFREIGVGYEESQMLLANHPELSLAPLDSLRARVRSLQSILGFDHLALYNLVTKRPTVLTAKEIDPLICFLRDELERKLEQAQMKRLISGTEPRFFVGFDQKVKLLLNRGVPREKIIHVLNNVNLTKALCHRSVDEINRTIDFLNPFGGINLIVRRPAIFNYDLDNQLIPRTKFLIELSGGDEDGTGKVLRKLPAILSYRVEHVEGHVEFLKSFAGLNEQEIFRIIQIFPSIVSASRERKLRPRIEFLKECGLDSDDIFKFLIKAPLFLGHSFHENIAYKLVFLVKIGYRYRTKDLAMAIGSTTRTSCENLQKVIDLFLSYGLSCEDIVAMSKRHPQILQYNHKSLEKKIKYLIEEMGRDIEELLVFPAFLGYKLDDRIKQRFEEKRSKRGERMSLNKLLTISTERFTRKRKKATAPDAIEII